MFTLEYLAGFFDGEGCIGIYETQAGTTFLSVSVGGLDPKPLFGFAEFFGGTVAFGRITGSGRPSYQWSLAAKKAGVVMTTLLPYLVVKKKQAEVAIRFQALIPGPGPSMEYRNHDERYKLMEEIRTLKYVAYNLDGTVKIDA